MQTTINQITQKTNLSIQQAWWLLEFITDKSRSQLQFSSEKLTANQQQKLDESIKQIAKDHKPLAYILGWVPFLDLELLVQAPTLIPRPETEHWVDELIDSIKKNDTTESALTFLDIGTGSGCIALSLAQAFPQAHVYAVDICPKALALAQKNAEKNKIANLTFILSDLFKNLPADTKFDLIVSNQPYINPTAQLDASVLNWEDHRALFANNQGLQIIEQIAQQTQKMLKENNMLDFQLVMEIDASQGEIVQKLLKTYKFINIIIKKDQFNRDRTVWTSLR